MAKKEAPVKKNDVIKITIDDLGTHGEGIGRYEGYTLFVDGGLPGEEVEVKVIKVNKNFGFGKLLHTITTSPNRVEPKCSVARQCGGCQLQHLSYDAQLAYKTKKVTDVLERIGKIDNVRVHDTIGMEDPWHYRNKVTYPVRSDNGLTKVGFYAGRSHRVVEHDTCYIQEQRNDVIVSTVKEWMIRFGITPYDEKKGTGMVRHIMTRHSSKEDIFHVTIVTNKRKMKHLDQLVEALSELDYVDGISTSLHLEKNNVILGETAELVWGNLYLEDTIGENAFTISPKSFFQVNQKQTEVLYDKTIELAGITGEETALDLYCGIGTISIALARKCKEVIGVEIAESAILDAVKNAEKNDLDNVRFYVGAAEEVIPALVKDESISADLVVVDPPRKGCEESLLETIVSIGPAKMVYVSCDPGTLARDLKYMVEKGYEVVEVQPVDLFPHTLHVETIVALNKVETIAIEEDEMEASERRVEQMRKSKALLEEGGDSELAKMLAEIEAKNNA